MKTRLILVRHAEAEGNINRHFHGWTNSDITKKGHVQAEKLAQRFENIHVDVIYSSSLNRTLQTASYISEVKGLPIIRTDKLKEINGGDWENQMWDVLPIKWPEEYNTWENRPHIHKMPNGESMEEFQQRLSKEIRYIADNNKGKTVCVVTHGTAIKALTCFFRGLSLENMIEIPWQDNTAITIVDYEEGKYNVIVEGDVSHLDSEIRTLENQDWWKATQYNIGLQSDSQGE